MKKTFLILSAFCIFGNAIAQKKDTIRSNADTVVTIHTPLLTLADYDEFVEKIVSDIPAKYADPIRNWLFQRFQAKAQQWKPNTTK